MSISIDTAFVKQFEREVFEAYQRMGSKLRPAVRSKNNIKGSSAVFQKVGTGTASTKSTHGMVPVMNVAHTTVEATLQDYYAGDWIDKRTEEKSVGQGASAPATSSVPIPARKPMRAEFNT